MVKCLFVDSVAQGNRIWDYRQNILVHLVVFMLLFSLLRSTFFNGLQCRETVCASDEREVAVFETVEDKNLS